MVTVQTQRVQCSHRALFSWDKLIFHTDLPVETYTGSSIMHGEPTHNHIREQRNAIFNFYSISKERRGRRVQISKSPVLPQPIGISVRDR